MVFRAPEGAGHRSVGAAGGSSLCGGGDGLAGLDRAMDGARSIRRLLNTAFMFLHGRYLLSVAGAETRLHPAPKSGWGNRPHGQYA